MAFADELATAIPIDDLTLTLNITQTADVLNRAMHSALLSQEFLYSQFGILSFSGKLQKAIEQVARTNNDANSLALQSIHEAIAPFEVLKSKIITSSLSDLGSASSYLMRQETFAEKALALSKTLELNNPYAIAGINYSDIPRTFKPYEIAYNSIGQFFVTSSAQGFLKGFEPIERFFTRLDDVLNSSAVEVSNRLDKIFGSEFDRIKTADLFKNLILLKSQYARSSALTDRHFDSGSTSEATEISAAPLPIQVETLQTPRKGNKQTTLSKVVRELLETGVIDEIEIEEAKILALQADSFFRENFPKVVAIGIRVLAKTSDKFVSGQPISADDCQELEQIISDSLRPPVSLPARGGNTRGHDTWQKVPPNKFVNKVDELYKLADALVAGYDKNRTKANWLDELKRDAEFKPFLEICSERAIATVAKLLPDRYKKSLPNKIRLAATPLAIACNLAALELNVAQKNDKSYKASYLLKIYRKGGGTRKQAGK